MRVAPDGALSLLVVHVQSDVHVADVLEGGRALGAPQRLTLDDGNDRPDGWLDGDRVVFTSDRTGSWDVWVQGLDDAAAESLISGPAWETWPVLRGDDTVWSWSLELDDEGEALAARIVSAPIDGGDVQEVATVEVERAIALRGRPPPRAVSFRCSGVEAPVCVLCRSVAGELRFHRLGPDAEVENPPFARLERPQAYYEWDLAPDASAVALVKMGFHITVLPLDGSGAREIELDTVGKLQYVRFSPDGSGFFLSAREWGGARYALVHAAPDGASHVLRSTDHAWLGQPAPSPDGARLAYAHQEYDSDVWLLAPEAE